MNDAELLRQFAAKHSQPAFAELVQRHLALVYSVALRAVGGDTHRAQEVAQQVFLALARKGAQLVERPTLAGWLYRAAQHAGKDALRQDLRRQRREIPRPNMSEIPHEDPEAWEHLRPALDALLSGLNDRDRDAVLLRYFEDQAYRDIGRRLGISENGARMRVERALEKLQGAFARRGIRSTPAALVTLLAAPASAVVPATLAGTISSTTALGVASTAGGSLIAFMSTIKLQVGASAALLAIGGASLGWHLQADQKAREELTRLDTIAATAAASQEEAKQLQNALAEAQALSSVDAEYARLHGEVEAVRQKQQLARTQPSTTSPAEMGPRLPAPVYSIHQLDEPPAVRTQRQPKYPAALREAGQEGEAVVAFVVAEDGRVAEVQAVHSTHLEFATAAEEAVSAWEFSPGIRQGLPVNTRLQVPIVFSTSKDPNTGPGLNNWFE